ncbi:DUF2202 domain-containing protein [Mangrovimonas sp. ST2L15]|uniref:DUF2202 domain-containing protein n=1 Tax=Mangrovimonas sp. ST2L15 TaxID=1645916 RepID=UPI0006B63533|nr:DUF2202 domain-containing protein [Mangrovimonas sp. ST2L15]
MKTLFGKTWIVMVAIMFTVGFGFSSCSDDDNETATPQLINANLTDSEEEALLFMLEEEKLARDVYIYLGNLWGTNQFLNIKQSEQTHMDAVKSLIDKYDVSYEILPVGSFNNQELQFLYNTLIEQGSQNVLSALNVGAGIEDLDIVDLQNYLDEMDRPDIVAVFESLQCGSENHLRSFVFGITNLGEDYVPSYLTPELYESILNSEQQSCL